MLIGNKLLVSLSDTTSQCSTIGVVKEEIILPTVLQRIENTLVKGVIVCLSSSSLIRGLHDILVGDYRISLGSNGRVKTTIWI